jgi:hypothetical protein
VPAQVLEDEAATDQADPAAGAEHAGDDADRDAHLLGRELVADDPEGQREDGRAGAWSTRQATIQPRLGAAAAPNEPSPNTARENTSIRFLPWVSPSMPSSGVRTDEDRRKPVTIQVVSAWEAWNSALKKGSAGMTSVCMTAKEIPAIASSAR